MLRRVVTAVVGLILLSLASCGRTGEIPSGPSGASAVAEWAAADRRDQQLLADAALKRWADAIAAGKGLALVGDLGFQLRGEFTGDKPQREVGRVDVAGTIAGPAPTHAALSFPDGSSRPISAQSADDTARLFAGQRGCAECRHVVITAASPTTTVVHTSRGDATVPAWEFTLQDTDVRLVRAALDPADFGVVREPPWDSGNPPAGLSIESAALAADGQTVTVSFTGARGPATEPCGIDYTAVPVESDGAVVMMLLSTPYSGPAEGACTMGGYPRTATAVLSKPLGTRAILEVRTGMPVPVSI